MAIQNIQSIYFAPIRGWKTPTGETVLEQNENPNILEKTGIEIGYGTRQDPNFYQLDGVIRENYTSTVSLTRNPVENGVIIGDHSYREPYVIQIEGIITNSPTFLQSTNRIPGTYGFDRSNFDNIAGSAITTVVNTFTGNRIREAWLGLTEIQNKRELLTLYTGLATYRNMVLTGLTTVNDSKNELRVNMTFTESIHIDSEGISTQNKLESAIYGLDLTRVLSTMGTNLSSAISDTSLGSVLGG